MGQGFRTTHQMTIGADFAVHHTKIVVNEIERDVMYQIWDLAGQPSFKTVRARFFRGAMAGICVFDINREESFQHLASWITELWQNCGRGVVPIIIIASKADTRRKDSISIETGLNYAKALSKRTETRGFQVHFIETSAKTGKNVEEAFLLIGKQIIQAMDDGKITI